MVTDAVLWLLLLVAIGLITLGCHATRQQPIPQRNEVPRDQLDRAA
jgi:hypothetical protein